VRPLPILLCSGLALAGLLGFTNCSGGFTAQSYLSTSASSTSLTGANDTNQSLCLVASKCPVTAIKTPAFKTEVVQFEDGFLYQPSAGKMDLIYRAEGQPKITRSVGTFQFQGVGAWIHPALYRKATLRLQMLINSGEPAIAIAHNGLSDIGGAKVSEPGVMLVFKTSSTDIVELSTGTTIASLKSVAPRMTAMTVSLSWDLDSNVVRLDLPSGSYNVALSKPLPEGGFALRSQDEATSFSLSKIDVLSQDDRQLVLYDEYDTLHNLDGTTLTRLPAAKLPSGMTSYQTVLVDLKKARALLFYGGTNLSIEDKTSIKGYAIRDLATGNVQLLPAPLNGCWLLQGGGGLDGRALVQSWTPPASHCWVDWNAYDRGDLVNFAQPTAGHQGSGAQGSTFIGYHDPASSLDGSLVRYLRVTEEYSGITHFMVHPSLSRFASFTDQAVPAAVNRQSQTGPSAPPTEFVVRDLDRAWYELWALNGTHLHTQMRGYNVFANEDDFATTAYPSTAPAEAYTDYANTAPSLTEPGHVWAPLIQWTPNTSGAVGQSLRYLSVGTNSFTSTKTIDPMPSKEHAPIQLLWPVQ
jgi:hypothetical protein